MMDALVADVRARSAQGPHASLLRTWTRLHRRWFGTPDDAVPLTPVTIYAVAAQMKDAGYRSFPNYMSAIKDLHVTEGFAWSEGLSAAATHAIASTQRGIGPPHQCSELRLTNALEVIGDSTEPMVHDGPGDCGHMFAIAYFHVVRGMELLCANVGDITIDYAAMSEAWALSVSKTDAQAIGCTRTWHCVCDGDRSLPCPVHSAMAHMAWLHDHFACEGVLARDLPLFPRLDGGRASSEALSATVAAVAERCGLPLVDTMGRASFTEHVFRVSGSRMLARVGVPTDVIMLLARWASEVIRRYVGDVPLEQLTQKYLNRTHGAALGSPPSTSTTAITSSATIEQQAVTPAELDPVRILELETRVELLAQEVQPEFVQNLRSGAVHRCGEYGRLTPASLWKTPCGWPFGSCGAECVWRASIGGIDADQICGTCLAPERAVALARNASLL